MILIDNFSQVTAQIETERGISKAELIEAIEQALISACRRNHSEEAILEAKIDPLTGEANIWIVKNVVKSVKDSELEITLNEAKKINAKAKTSQEIRIEVTPADFGRIAAQTAKQVIIQRIREAEKNVIYNEFKQKEGEIIVGTVQKIEGRNILINLGRIEALLPYHEQIPGENFQVNEKIKLYVAKIEKNPKGPVIQISRAHAGLLRRLFELEVPEIHDEIIEIKSIAREPGKRSKVAVKSNNPTIGAVGTCVGHMGGRIQTIIKEIGNEKIDILEWHEDPKQFVSNSLKPAKITEVIIMNEKEKEALVVVPNDQLSLAIGKVGVNVRLAVKLTGWKLDILSEEEYSKKEGEIKAKTHVSIVDRIQQETKKMKEDLAKEESIEESISVAALAKELKMKTKDLMEKAKGFDLKIKTNRSKLTMLQAQEIRDKINC